jgi:hypothetical protein
LWKRIEAGKMKKLASDFTSTNTAVQKPSRDQLVEAIGNKAEQKKCTEEITACVNFFCLCP